jgi:hypothetical protein
MDRAREGSAPRLFEVDRFEHLTASPERILLRVDGRYVDRPGRRILDATLFVDDGLAVRRHAALPEPSALADADIDGWLWRAAFAVPASYLTDARTSFALEAEPGTLLALPDPHPSAAGRVAQPLSERAARTARRYAAAIAVMVTVAVTPGVLAANAGIEILKVRRADGSIEYLRSDGAPVAQIPPDAYIVDETGSANTVVQSDSGAGAQDAASGPGAHGGTSRTVVPSDSPNGQRRPAQPHAPAPAAPAPQRPAPRPHRHVAASPRYPQAPARPPAPDTRPVTTPERAGARFASVGSVGEIAPPPTADAARLKPLGAPALGSGPAETAGAPALQPLAPVPAATDAPELQALTAAPAAGDALQADGSAQPPANPPLEPLTPRSTLGSAQPHSGSREPAVRPQRPRPAPRPSAPPLVRPTPAAQPAPSLPSAPAGNPAPFDALPGPTSTVPSFVIDNFQIPPFLLPIYQAAATEYGVRWEVLAAINEIETDYGRDLSVSSAGALGWMQFMPETWKTYGVDANRDGKRDPYNPADAIFAAARYLKAAGGDKDVRQAIYAYNHATWYVDSVMLRAQLIAAYPPELVGALAGLTQGRFPIAAPARYAGEVTPGKPAPSATDLPTEAQHGTDIYSTSGAPVVAVADGVVKRIGRSTKKGLYVVLQDAYGNEYTYSGLGEIAHMYPVPNVDAISALSENAASGGGDPAPHAAASAGTQAAGASSPAGWQPSGAPQQPVATKLRLFAHPARPADRDAGGTDQIFQADQAKQGFVAYDGYFADVLGLNSKNATLRPLRAGAPVIASTVLGRVAQAAPRQQARIHFEVRPAGKGAPQIDPRPVLDGWRLLESTQAYGPSGRKALSKKVGPITVGEAMLLPKPLLEQWVLSDTRLKIYAAGREDIKTGQIDRRVLEVLEYLADAGLNPTVSSLKSGHGALTSSGNESEHASGNAVDIAAINDIPIEGHQNAGGIAEQAVRRLMQLQGTLRPHQIISLLAFGQNTLALPDHANHIHIGFQPLFGDNAALGKATMSALGPQQWGQLANRLGQIGNPAVPTAPSKYALPDQ